MPSLNVLNLLIRYFSLSFLYSSLEFPFNFCSIVTCILLISCPGWLRQNVPTSGILSPKLSICTPRWAYLSPILTCIPQGEAFASSWGTNAEFWGQCARSGDILPQIGDFCWLRGLYVWIGDILPQIRVKLSQIWVICKNRGSFRMSIFVWNTCIAKLQVHT